VSEQQSTAALLREVSEHVAEANDKLTAAQLREREQENKLRKKFNALARAVVALADELEERVS
jgi:hypothetical protein